MAVKESSATSLTMAYYMRNFYKGNPAFAKSSNRGDYTNTELSYEDARALKRAAKELMSYSYSDADNGENLYETIQAFVDTYNNTMDSSKGVEDPDISRLHKNLKKLTSEYSDKLKKIGITIKEDGSLKVAENTLKGSTVKEIKEAFSKEAGLMEQTKRLANKMNQNAYDLIYTELTGNGGKLNITL